ncbi:Coilin like protein [Argiope bruennichi]|uniref:Coilin like protein n=1 Tax=Argiope bruennichi TaxID=94029 RepID=A0A8T0FQW4_ARGBR|nr:Coilin like protein [Argiope bruennichi]
MSISPRELLTINDLKDAILKKFAFERTDLLLFLRDGLLPEDENITNILRENDNVRLFYAEPSNLNLNDSKVINYEEVGQSAIDVKVKSPEKRKGHSDILEDSNELEKPNKKRKCNFSNGTYIFKSNSSTENISLNAVSNDAENITNSDLYNFGSEEHCKSSKIKKKLKYSNDVPQNSLISENETFLSCDIVPVLEKNQSKNENSLFTRSSPSVITKNKNDDNTSNQEKSLPVKINNSSTKSSDSFSNKGINRFLDPNFSYKSFPPLNSCPLVGTHIAYKVLELDASYSPVVSNYKEGIVKAVNSQTDELEIELVEPEVKEGRTGKFEILYQDELPSCEVIKKVTLNWTSLIDPVRVI